MSDSLAEELLALEVQFLQPDLCRQRSAVAATAFSTATDHAPPLCAVLSGFAVTTVGNSGGANEHRSMVGTGADGAGEKIDS